MVQNGIPTALGNLNEENDGTATPITSEIPLEMSKHMMEQLVGSQEHEINQTSEAVARLVQTEELRATIPNLQATIKRQAEEILSLRHKASALEAQIVEFRANMDRQEFDIS